VCGKTRNDLIKSFRDWKGFHYFPQGVHSAIKWSKQDPLNKSSIVVPSKPTSMLVKNILPSTAPPSAPKPYGDVTVHPAHPTTKRKVSHIISGTSNQGPTNKRSRNNADPIRPQEMG